MEPPSPKLAPDGLPIILPWGDFHVGESVFIPCLNHSRARSQLARLAQLHAMRLSIRTSIENGMLGLRVWRTA